MTLCACNLIVESGYIFSSSQALLHQASLCGCAPVMAEDGMHGSDHMLIAV